MRLAPARLLLPAARLGQCRRGFNLIEAAIVLGVVGIIIGGIWVAASTVSENLKTKKTIEGVVLILKNLQNTWSPTTFPQVDIDSTDGNTIANYAVAADLIPADWKGPCIGGAICNPFGGYVLLWAGQRGTDSLIRIGFRVPSRVASNRILNTVIASFRGNVFVTDCYEWTGTAAAGYWGSYGTGPANCPESSNGWVDLNIYIRP